MDNPNINDGNQNILSGNEEGVNSQQKSDQDKENVNVHKNEHLEGSEKPQQDQEIADNSQRSGQENENEQGKHLQLLKHVFITESTFALSNLMFPMYGLLHNLVLC